MHIGFLIGSVFVVMALALAATLLVGFSRSNRSESSAYGRGTGKKWTRLGSIYVLCVVLIIAILLFTR
ncbi:hypothetical protein [Cohnella nanjingensis]|uniref:Uncharacterized protein n=1 Tax=Cohnella nanjingensis TaxID=1387779 RepID=A0A7X0RSV0_9BACL|nr:hypothetical protein [Cohnella nanjingensis]MBB6672891.1 hypothetical protein [Cohnella nanjingensis]